MLNFEQIKEYFSPKLVRLNPRGILVEYLQHECLDSLFKQADSEHLSFIGGTAIRIIYNSQRFSEDLDFDNFGLNFERFKALTEKMCREIKQKGFNLEYRFVEREVNFHCYLKFPELLKQVNLSGHQDEKILVSIDMERKKKITNPEIKTINKFGIYRNIPVELPPTLLAQKLITILQRKNERGRDFYDTSFLSGLTKPDYSYILTVTGCAQKEFREKLLARCAHFNYKVLAEDVSPFLMDYSQKTRVLDFPNTIETILETN